MALKPRYVLYLILFFALLVRIFNISWGLPLFDNQVVDRYHPDEFKIIFGAKNFPKDILTRTDLRYPTALHYLIGLINYLLKNIDTPIDAIQIVYLLGRAISVVFGVLSVYCTYLLGKRLSNEYGGLIAASLLAISLYHVRGSSVATTDVATSFWAVCVLLQSLKIDQTSNPKEYIVLGALFGILIGTKYPGAFFALPILIIFLRLFLDFPKSRKRNLLMFALFSVTSLTIFLLTTPSILLHPSAFLNSLQYENTRLAELRSPIWQLVFFIHFFSSLAQSSNSLICFIIIVTLILVMLKQPPFNLRIYAILSIIYYFYFNTALLPRYWIILLPMLCALAGWGMIELMAHKKLHYPLVSLYLMAIFLGVTQSYSLTRLALHDTRSLAAQYLAQQPLNAKIMFGLGSAENDGWQYPPVRQEIMTEVLEFPDYIILSSFVDQLPKEDHLPFNIGFQDVFYKRIKTFRPITSLKMEFMSPTIEVFVLDN